MTQTTKGITLLNITELFDPSVKYIIPIYQRNYSWGETQIIQLVQDIIDYCHEDQEQKYYLGTLVVHKDKGDRQYITIDGQQRLTTLSILLSVLKIKLANSTNSALDWLKEINLSFESRINSNRTLIALFNCDFNEESLNESILNCYNILDTSLFNKLTENYVNIDDFVEYLLEKVMIVRAEVPPDTDLNHYFEIMNNRGEQLEKHEILKSQLLKELTISSNEFNEVYSIVFNMIWEACANMEKYVQYGFSSEHRHLIFGTNDWNNLTITNFDQLCDKLKDSIKIKSGEVNKSITEIISSSGSFEIKIEEEKIDRFTSVINFPNFLLHVLRIQQQNSAIALDDKRLLKLFKVELKNSPDKFDFVKSFAFNLLRYRFLFDQYIIKRAIVSGNERWIMKKLAWSNGNKPKYINTFGNEEEDVDISENKNIIMILSMLHVSSPSMNYKYWLNTALNYVCQQNNIQADEYLDHLERLAGALVFDRLLSDKQKAFENITLSHPIIIDNTYQNLLLENLRFGKVQNLIFNYIDYLLWKKEGQTDTKIRNFEFSQRNSVEHYYPQNPINGEYIEERYLHSFGNLCLITASQNSRLSCFMPISKSEYYTKKETMDSIKQYIMMKVNPRYWHIDSIERHNEDMTTILINELQKLRNNSTAYEIPIDNPLKNKSIDWFDFYKSENMSLLARALMCFGDIAYPTGWSYGGDKYNLFSWNRIREAKEFRDFNEFIEKHQPESLEEIIEFQLKYNEELRKDSYRYIFVKYPEIISYCKNGNFGWINDGRKIILMESERASSYLSCDLYCFLLQKYISDNYKIRPYCDRNYLCITLKESERILDVADIDWANQLTLYIWNDGNNHLCYELNPREAHGNLKILQTLKLNGWEYNSDGKLFYTTRQFLSKLGDDHESNINSSFRDFDTLVNLIKRSSQIY